MRSRLGIALSLAVLATAGGLLMMTAASGQTVLHMVVEVSMNSRVAVDDIDQDGRLRLGDRIAARGALMDESRTDRLGTSYIHCVVHKRIVDPDQGLWNCNYVLELSEGDIVLQGLDPRGSGEYEMAVLGGTGTYAGASGSAMFTDVSSDTGGYTDIVINLEG
ncbi:MAG: allene oxide cyclase barrel-like domain-containing protein [Actinomycetota bacterium]